MVTLAQIIEAYNASFPAGYGPLSDGVPPQLFDVATERTAPQRKRGTVTRRIRKARQHG